ncbi:MAG: FAD-dependent monooxygenase [Candidatus Devosia phytovorans]|uniref:FAD-dependent monooxygenase n=1 Tax=Candidatus Devosia phytovorans TaxID=3121372 RepID=A0AAJ6B0W5_9HYPH|nr:FAD-dependent monooxygenase [Devosia sp.]WEK05647.1 MAG: FAD-dependent monooxygenase [Devosia sp.]
MPATGQTYIIAGAGIAGLTLALALAKFGAHVVILERHAAVSEFGAGLQISPNARKVLNNLGLDDALSELALEPVGVDIYPYRRKRPIATMQMGAAMRERFGAAYAVMHRADLAEALYRATRPFANIDIVFNVKSWDAVSTPDGVTVTINEANDQSRTVRGRAFIGADGVHSQTRARLLDGPVAKFGGRVAWRALVPFESASDLMDLDRVSILFGPDYHMVCYPLPHRQQVNLALFAKARLGDIEVEHRPELPASLQKSSRIEALIKAAGDSWTTWPLFTVRTPIWHKGNIGLIGDAAHAMVPFQAQGAAMGIEDAAVLAPLLVSEPSAGAAFARYQQVRQPRVTRVADLSLLNGRIFHMHWPLSIVRNLGVRIQGQRGHMRRLAWLYGYEVTPLASPGTDE